MLWVFCFFVPPTVIYFPFKKQWNRIYPKWAALWERKKIKKFSPSDVEYSKEKGWYCEIPLFKNVILDYETKKEFSKQLRFIEIEEYKFKYYTSRTSSLKKYSNRTKKRKLRNRRKRELNEWLWYARFYFKDKPKEGYLWVLFK